MKRTCILFSAAIFVPKLLYKYLVLYTGICSSFACFDYPDVSDGGCLVNGGFL